MKKKKMKDTDKEKKNEVESAVEQEAEEVVNEDENNWKEKYEEMNDKYLRIYSEFDNFRKRTQKEKMELYRTAGEDIMTALLPVLDDFERAEKSMTDEVDTKSLKEGVDLIYQKLFGILKNKGLARMESPIGKNFDVETQEAITKIPAAEDSMKGKVIDEVEAGYQLNEKVIRYAKVVVGE